MLVAIEFNNASLFLRDDGNVTAMVIHSTGASIGLMFGYDQRVENLCTTFGEGSVESKKFDASHFNFTTERKSIRFYKKKLKHRN